MHAHERVVTVLRVLSGGAAWTDAQQRLLLALCSLFSDNFDKYGDTDALPMPPLGARAGAPAAAASASDIRAPDVTVGASVPPPPSTEPLASPAPARAADGGSPRAGGAGATAEGVEAALVATVFAVRPRVLEVPSAMPPRLGHPARRTVLVPEREQTLCFSVAVGALATLLHEVFKATATYAYSCRWKWTQESLMRRMTASASAPVGDVAASLVDCDLFDGRHNFLTMHQRVAEFCYNSTYRTVRSLDIRQFFASMNHATLRERILSAWDELYVERAGENFTLFRRCMDALFAVLETQWNVRVRGVPVGLAASRLLGDMMLASIDLMVARSISDYCGSMYFRFGDDIRVVGTAPTSLFGYRGAEVLEARVMHDVQKLKLTFNPDKDLLWPTSAYASLSREQFGVPLPMGTMLGPDDPLGVAALLANGSTTRGNYVYPDIDAAIERLTLGVSTFPMSGDTILAHLRAVHAYLLRSWRVAFDARSTEADDAPTVVPMLTRWLVHHIGDLEPEAERTAAAASVRRFVYGLTTGLGTGAGLGDGETLTPTERWLRWRCVSHALLILPVGEGRALVRALRRAPQEDCRAMASYVAELAHRLDLEHERERERGDLSAVP